MTLSNSNWIGEERHKIRINEIDNTGYASFPALLHLLQEVAWNNSKELNFSVYDMMKHGVTWVVYRMQFEIFGYPKHYDEVIVRSWPSGRDRLYTYRDYQLLSADEKELVRGTSAWLVFDMKRRRPVPIPEVFRKLEFPPDVERKVLDTTKIAIPEKKANKIKVVFQDQDMNGHTYNVHYIQWILEDLYQHLGEIRRPRYLDVIFKGETVQGDELITYMDKDSDHSSIHLVKNNNTERNIFQGKVSY